ncbi:MAG TPA: Ku protein [Vulgatibacter sp.]|nr:Ku protein [Vulgatibacter sp.]
MARPTWKGSIVFGLVRVPVQLYRATHAQDVRFHMLHDADGARIKQLRVCSLDGEEVEWEHIVKGYEVAKGEHVVVTDEELEAFAMRPSKAIEIGAFVDLAEIDPVYQGGTDYLVPEPDALKAYHLLAEVLEREGKAGIARMTLRTKESLVAIRAEGGKLLLTGLNRQEEVVPWERVGPLEEPAEASDLERKMAQQLVEAMSAPFEPHRYPDEARARLKELLRKKIEGEEIVAVPEAPLPSRVISLVDALQRSLEAREAEGAAAPRSGGREGARARPRSTRRTPASRTGRAAKK